LEDSLFELIKVFMI